MTQSERPAERGSAIISILIVSLFVIAGMQWYSRAISQMSKEDVHSVTTQKAADLADSGVYSALHMLRSPGASTNLPVGTWLNASDPGAPVDLSSTTPMGRFDVSLYRNASDSSLVDAYSTGYYYIPTGAFLINGKRAQRAVARANIRVRYVGDFFAAVPDTLTVGYGTDISSGDIYGKSIIFQPPDGVSPNRTRVRAAYYLSGFTPTPASFVTFYSTPAAPTKVNADPNLVSPDAAMRASYQKMAGVTETLAAGAVLSGNFPLTAPSNPYKVYFCPGDIHLGGSGAPLVMNEMVVIYVKGSVYIDNSITLAAGGTRWLGIIAEGDIHITSLAPNNLSISGTFVTGGRFVADGNARPSGNLTFKGGFIAKTGVDFAGVWRGSRTYTFTSADTSMALPYFTYFESYSSPYAIGRNN